MVYLAHDEGLERDVALKVLPAGSLSDETARKRFRKEARALSKLNHPNIATVHEFNQQDGVDFLVMEYIAGVTLAAKLARGSLPEKDVAQLGQQLADGLVAAHEQGLVHRDLKPGNLRLTADGRLKILDFGLAKFLRPAGVEAVTADTLTETQCLAGTMPYMAPEQLRGEPSDARTDIYAAGVVLYEMATGRRPFEAKLATALAADIQHKAPIPPHQLNPRISTRLEEIILKCLDKEPDSRYQAAKELAVDLRRLVSPTATAAESPALRSRFRVPLLIPLAIVSALAIVLSLMNLSPWRKWLGLSANAPRIESLAVLPLENLSSDPSQEYFVDGMTDELITDLSKISALRVISRTSVMEYKATHKPLSQIARELRVDAIIEGSVLRDGNRVRIGTRLTQAAADKLLWAESYEGDLHDVLTLQNHVARSIADAVRSKLTPAEQSRLRSSSQVDSRAYDLYLRGRYNWNQRNPASLQRALQYFQRAIEIDPTYAVAYAGLADTYNLLGSSGVLAAKDALDKARAAAQRALELDDTLAEPHASLAGVLQSSNNWDFRAAEVEFRRAIELNPNYATAHFWYGLNLLPLKRADEAVSQFRQAEALDPLSPLISTYVGFALEKARRYDEAIDANRKTISSFADFDFGHWTLGMAYRQKANYEEAISEFKKAIELSGGRPDYIACLGHAYALSGNTTEARKIARQLEASKAPAFALAILYLGLSDKDRTFALLEQAYTQRFSVMPEALQDPLFDPIRPDARFRDLLRRMNLPE